MIKLSPHAAHGVEAYKPLLAMLESVLLTPAELCEHWRLSPSHLCNLRRREKGIPFIKLAGGSGIRYRLSEVAAAEISGSAGPMTVERVCLALAACEALTIEARAMAQDHIRKSFAQRSAPMPACQR